jgi:hypothetical protein
MPSHSGAFHQPFATLQCNSPALIFLPHTSRAPMQTHADLLAITPMIIGARVLCIVISLILWHFTQRLLARRNPSESTATSPSPVISDGLHDLTRSINQRLLDHPRQADRLLIASSAVIDLLGIYLLISSIFGASFGPYLGLLLIFAVRQICQAFCPLPPPVGMIWRSPGVPSLLVTYGTSCDLFFSGHTAIAVYGAAVLADHFGPIGIAAGCGIAAFEIGAVLVLRAHYTMDVFTGAIVALYLHRVTGELAPHVDGLFRHLAG